MSDMKHEHGLQNNKHTNIDLEYFTDDTYQDVYH